ncbi:hypothetical protein [Oscillatoria sp. HE19RPO]|uniref:hypothetical protein n=1 Tax=Oscillatoria sp. HE19RPO TaxID=2954806 RepID=UPI0020C42EAE|nr:hypothetical protein [Oscillatoria sp. HE19RPO]
MIHPTSDLAIGQWIVATFAALGKSVKNDTFGRGCDRHWHSKLEVIEENLTFSK